MNANLHNMKQNVSAGIYKKLSDVAKNNIELENLLEEFIERAGIIEFDGGLSRFMAERKALECVLQNHTNRKTD